MKEIYLIKHGKGALGLRCFGLGPNLKPTNGLIKLQKLLDSNAFWAKNRTINDLKKCLANSDVVISLWVGKEIVGFGRALTDGVYRGVLWDIVIDQNHQGKGFGTLIVKNLLSSEPSSSAPEEDIQRVKYIQNYSIYSINNQIFNKIPYPVSLYKNPLLISFFFIKMKTITYFFEFI